MSAYEQGGEAPSAGAAAAPAGAVQQSKQDTLEEKMRELKEKIENLEKKISSDEDKADNTKIEAIEVALRNSIVEDKKKRNLLEARRDRLEAQIEKLSAPAEQPTSAGGCSPSSCLPLRSLIGLPRRVLRALLLLREFVSPFHLCAQPLHLHLASQPGMRRSLAA